MILFNNTLNRLNIEYKRESEKGGKIIKYWCKYNYDYDMSIPFYIIVDKNNKTFGLYSPPLVRVIKKMRSKVLEDINFANFEIVYGQFFIDNEDDLIYYQGISLEGEGNLINDEQLLDYIKVMIINVRRVTFDSIGSPRSDNLIGFACADKYE